MNTKKRFFACLALFIMCFIMLQPIFVAATVNGTYNVTIVNGVVRPDDSSLGGSGASKALNMTKRMKDIATFIGGFATVTMVAAVIYNIVRLNIAADNPMQRQQCLKGILVCGVMAALLGSATLFVGLFYGLFRT